MSKDQQVESLAAIVFGGVAITASALEHATDGQEVTFTQWRAILFVGEDADGRRVGEVAGFVNSSLPTTSRLLRRLERRGLLVLERDELDRRATRARLTESGMRIRAAVLDYRRREIARIVDEVKLSASTDRDLRDLAARFDAFGHAPPAPTRRPEDREATR